MTAGAASLLTLAPALQPIENIKGFFFGMSMF